MGITYDHNGKVLRVNQESAASGLASIHKTTHASTAVREDLTEVEQSGVFQRLQQLREERERQAAQYGTQSGTGSEFKSSSDRDGKVTNRPQAQSYGKIPLATNYGRGKRIFSKSAKAKDEESNPTVAEVKPTYGVRIKKTLDRVGSMM